MDIERRTNRPPPNIWKNASWNALMIAAVALIVIKMFTGIVFMAAFITALVVFLIAFAFIIRMSAGRR